MRVNLEEHGLEAIYQFYKTTTKTPLAKKQFKAIAYEYFQQARAAILEGANLKLPCRLGFIRVQKREVDYDALALDYEYFNKTGEKSYHLNMHSDGFRGRFLWEKHKCLVSGKLPYAFTACRDMKRDLAQVFKTEGGHRRFALERY